MKKILFLLFTWFCFFQVHAGNKIFYLQGDVRQSKVIVTQGTSVSLNIPELCGVIQFGIIKGNESIWFKDAKNLKVKQDNRIITYTLKDKILENGEIIFRMKPMKNADGFLIEMSCINCPGNANLLWCYGGAYNKVIKNKEDCMLLPEYCKENIFSIIDILMKGVLKRLSNLGFKLDLSIEAKEFIAEKGYDPQFGARPLKRAIQKYLEDEMAEIIIKASITDGDTISVGFDKKNEKLQMRILSKNKALKE